MVNEKINNISNCPVMEQTGDGTLVGRCWFFLPDGKTCPRHGDVSKAVRHYKQTGKCLIESEL